jgi:hypothetical protein
MDAPLSTDRIATPRSRSLLRAVGVFAFFALLIALKTWLVRGQMRIALGFASHDDQLFLRLALNLVRGKWLGPYDGLTLAKAPGYPLWMAFVHDLGVPLHIADTLLFALACVVVVRGLRPLLSRSVSGVLFVLLLFHPMSFTSMSLRYVRDSIYPAQTLLVLGCLFGIALRPPSWKSLAWGAGLGVSLAFFWLSREESIWLLPALLAGAVLFVWSQRGASRFWILGGATALLAVLPPVLAVERTASINHQRYGVRSHCEVLTPEFRAAYGAMTRVRIGPQYRYVPLSCAERNALYSCSPAFAELRRALEGDIGYAWFVISSRMLTLPPEAEGEIPGFWFLWALRDAVQEAGHSNTGAEALAFYARLAEEINAACAEGRLGGCEGERTSVVPRWRNEYFVPCLRETLTTVRILARLEGYSEGTESKSDRVTFELFRFLTHDRMAPVLEQGAAADEAPSEVVAEPALPGARRRAVLSGLASGYRFLFPFGLLAAAGLGLAAFARSSSRRRMRVRGVLLVLVFALGARLAMVAYLAATSFNASNARYLAPLDPLLLTCAVLLAADGWRALRSGAGDSLN